MNFAPARNRNRIQNGTENPGSRMEQRISDPEWNRESRIQEILNGMEQEGISILE